jgi:hypothetical protein
MATGNEIKPNLLDNKLVDLRAEGLSWDEIEERTGIDGAEAFRRVQRFLKDAPALSIQEYRLIHLRRLELLVQSLWDQVMGAAGSVVEWQRLEVYLKTLDRIAALLDLNMETTKTEIRVIEDKQVTVIVAALDNVAELLRQNVQELVTTKANKELLNESWDAWVAQAVAASEDIIEAEVVEA